MTSVLLARGALLSEQYLDSPDMQYRLIMQADGNLVLYKGQVAQWATYTGNSGGPGGNKLVMEYNAIVRRANGSSAWSTNIPRAYIFEEMKDENSLQVQNDGNVVVVNATRTWTSYVVRDPETYPEWKYIQTGATLLPGAELVNGNYRLVFQTDGNLVSYQNGTNKVIWASYTQGKGATRCTMQDDGNFVIYAGNTALWHTQTAGQGPSYMGFSKTGILTLLRPTAHWSRYTGQLTNYKPP